jgi:hypothetical protein
MVTLPFTDVAGNAFFCQIAEAYFSGLTNGTTPTTYSPSNGVSREQMAAFVTRTQDAALRRGSRRAALKQWATPPNVNGEGATNLGSLGALPVEVESDGADLWMAEFNASQVVRVRASDNRVLETWTGATSAVGVLCALGAVWVTGATNPGSLYLITPRLTPGSVNPVSSTLGNSPYGITTDGTFIWTANAGGSVSKFDARFRTTTNIVTGFSSPRGILFDGANIWVTDEGDSKLKKLDSSGGILQSVPMDAWPNFPVFDGANIWVPNIVGNSLKVVRARDGLVLATLTGNGLSGPLQAAFDRERSLVTNQTGKSVSMWKATDLTPIGVFPLLPDTGTPNGVCSDGINFWITISDRNLLYKF